MVAALVVGGRPLAQALGGLRRREEACSGVVGVARVGVVPRRRASPSPLPPLSSSRRLHVTVPCASAAGPGSGGDATGGSGSDSSSLGSGPLPLAVGGGVVIYELGSLYRGPNEDNFWSDRRRASPSAPKSHPYPVGYRATKLYKGRLYHVRTQAGPTGPRFVVQGAGAATAHAADTPSLAWAAALGDSEPGEERPAVNGRAFFGFTADRTVQLLRSMAMQGGGGTGTSGDARFDAAEPAIAPRPPYAFPEVRDGRGEGPVASLASVVGPTPPRRARSAAPPLSADAGLPRREFLRSAPPGGSATNPTGRYGASFASAGSDGGPSTAPPRRLMRDSSSGSSSNSGSSGADGAFEPGRRPPNVGRSSALGEEVGVTWRQAMQSGGGSTGAPAAPLGRRTDDSMAAGLGTRGGWSERRNLRQQQEDRSGTEPPGGGRDGSGESVLFEPGPRRYTRSWARRDDGSAAAGTSPRFPPPPPPGGAGGDGASASLGAAPRSNYSSAPNEKYPVSGPGGKQLEVGATPTGPIGPGGPGAFGDGPGRRPGSLGAGPLGGVWRPGAIRTMNPGQSPRWRNNRAIEGPASLPPEILQNASAWLAERADREARGGGPEADEDEDDDGRFDDASETTSDDPSEEEVAQMMMADREGEGGRDESELEGPTGSGRGLRGAAVAWDPDSEEAASLSPHERTARHIRHCASTGDLPAAIAILDAAVAAAGGPRAFAMPLSTLAAFWPHKLDMWQTAGLKAIHGGRSVLVCGPAGIGKWSVVAAAALLQARVQGRRAIVVCPQRSLAKQRWRQLAALYGESNVGQMWGDHFAAPPVAAPIVVASIEAYRQALYALGAQKAAGVDSPPPGALSAAALAGRPLDLQARLAAALLDVDVIILDEFQALSDRKRGTMMEEAILWAPVGAQTIALSAIVRGAEGLQAWLSELLPGCELVVCEKSPVPLRHYFLRPGSIVLLGGRMSPSLLPEDSGRRSNEPALPAGGFDAGGKRVDEASTAAQGANKRPSLRYVLWQLKQRHMLPAVFFIFSRVACNAAVVETSRACLSALVRPSEAAEIRARLTAFQQAHPGHWRADDAEALLKGIAAHHAGLLPAWRELVEGLAADGLLRLLFATETMASSLKINMRTVVLSSLTKMQGDDSRRIQASELTQILSRVGRRGEDPHGNVVVLQAAATGREDAADLLRLQELRHFSRFQPTYSTVLNLLRVHPLARTRELLARNFGDFAVRAATELNGPGGPGAGGGAGGYSGPSSFGVATAINRPPFLADTVVLPSAAASPPLPPPASRVVTGGLREVRAAEAAAAAAAAEQSSAMEAYAAAQRAQTAAALRSAAMLTLVELAPEAAPPEEAGGVSPVAAASGVGPPLPAVLIAVVAGAGAVETHYVCLARDNVFRMLPARALAAVRDSLPPLALAAVGLKPPVMPAPECWHKRPFGLPGYQATGGTASMAAAALIPASLPAPLPIQRSAEPLRSRLSLATNRAAAAARRLEEARNPGASAGAGAAASLAGAEPAAPGTVAPAHLSYRPDVWSDAQKVIRVLVEAGALAATPQGGVCLTPLGRTAAQLQAENELWAAQVLESGALAGLSAAELAGAVAAVAQAPQGNIAGRRAASIWTPRPLPPALQSAVDDLGALASTLTALHKAHEVRILVIFDRGPAALVYAWATGAPWGSLRSFTSLDEGDVCRVLKRTHGLLLQAAALEELEPAVRANAVQAAQLIGRFPVAE